MEFFILIIGILVLVLVLNLRGRVQKLEKYIKTGSTEPAVEANHQRQQAAAVVPVSLLDYIKQQLKQGVDREEIKNSLTRNGWQMPDIEGAFNSLLTVVPSDRLTTSIVQGEPMMLDKFIAWFKEDWLLKLGALLLLIGFGWLASYAFLNNWIGPMGRITLGIVAGAFFILLGWWRIKSYLHQGGIFLVLGSTTILLTVFAAREIYDFFTPFSALAVMFLSTAFVALASVKYNNRALAFTSLILAGIAPLFTNSPTDDVGLFSYLLVVTLGTIWIVVLTGRRELTMAALLIITAYSLPYLLYSPSTEKGTLLLFVYAFAAVFFLTNTAGILKSKSKDILPDLVTAASNGLFLLAWIMVAAQDEWKSLIISEWMLTFTVGAFLIFRITRRREPFYVYAGVGVAMLAAATSAELNGATLTIAYIIESGIIALTAFAVMRDIKIAERISFLLICPAALSINSFTSELWLTSVFHKDFFVFLMMSLVLFGLGVFFLRHVREVEDDEPRQLNAILLIAGSAYAYALLWLSLHAALESDGTAVMISLLIYTIVGLVTYFYGLTNNKKGFQFYGGVLVGFVVARLLLVDVWSMELAGKIITFFLIGTLLVSTAFLGRKNKHKTFSDTTQT